MGERIPAMVFSLAEHLADEMIARGWTAYDVAKRMNNRQSLEINVLTVNLVLAVDDDGAQIGSETMTDLALAFDLPVNYLHNLHNAWLRWPDRRSVFMCPESLLVGHCTATQESSHE